MNKNAVGSNTITQIGLVVKDIEKSLDAYCEVFGIARPSVIITDDFDFAQTRYRGLPSKARAKLAFLDMGQVQIELIQPDGQPSTWQEALDSNGESVHHIAFQIKNTAAVVKDLANHEIQIVQQGQYKGGMYTYVDSTDKLGVVLELLENFE
jgi:methylmalonyl-CoA/ethylmalonyl-CoA epimerase